MFVKDGMSTVVLTVGPDRKLREVARLMKERDVGAAIVVDPDQPGPGIVTERDVLKAVATSDDAIEDPVSKHSTERAVFAAPDWSLERAADEMVKGGFRHLIVVDHGEITGILSMRDIVTCWVQDGATSEVGVAHAAG